MVLEATRIDFRDIAGGTVRNISGHERGAEARKKYNLDQLDDDGEIVSVIIPDDIDAVAGSFSKGCSRKVSSVSSPRTDFSSITSSSRNR